MRIGQPYLNASERGELQYSGEQGVESCIPRFQDTACYQAYPQALRLVNVNWPEIPSSRVYIYQP